ncbi:MAG TPA: hypothetical protein VN737_04420 [Bryobacteraceae bacterium]|nr:hypothetical protein [Bryobacteraceae bacterium]
MVNVAEAAREIAKLGMLKYFPADKEARAAIVEMACGMASDNAQITWLVKRALALYNEWPGPNELRAAFCSKFRPRDGITAYSRIYADGIPSEKQGFAAALPSPDRKALPAGAASADPELSAKAKASVKRLPSAPLSRSGFARTIAEVVTAPQDRKELPGPTEQVITREDCERAAEENRKRATGAAQVEK